MESLISVTIKRCARWELTLIHPRCILSTQLSTHGIRPTSSICLLFCIIARLVYHVLLVCMELIRFVSVVPHVYLAMCASVALTSVINILICCLDFVELLLIHDYIFITGTTSATPTNSTTQHGFQCPPGFYCPAGSSSAIACPLGTFQKL